MEDSVTKVGIMKNYCSLCMSQILLAVHGEEVLVNKVKIQVDVPFTNGDVTCRGGEPTHPIQRD